MKLRLMEVWESLRGSYWFLPTMLALASMLLAAVTLRIDEAIGRERANSWGWLYTGGASGARDVLAAIAGSTITVAGTTFSITIAVLQLTSGQYGPRLLRNFMRDAGNQAVLGTFIATFLYCLLVLRRVQGIDDFEFVPHLSVTVGTALGIISVGVLIYFIHHIATSIQAANVIAVAGREMDAAIDRLFPEMIGRGAEADETPPVDPALPPRIDEEAAPLTSHTSGYVTAVDGDRLLAFAQQHDAILCLERRPGHFAIVDRPLARVWPSDRATDALCNDVNSAFNFGAERTQTQDAEFPINQLVEIAVRALSPGINDPFTAITCIDRLTAGLCRLTSRQMPSPYRYDEAGKLRVIAVPPTFDGLVDAAFNQIRQYGATSVAVTIRLLEAITTVAGCVQTSQQRAALLRHAAMVHRDGSNATGDPSDRADIDQRYAAAQSALTQST
jgi:uncharacterized membrane protein